MENRITHQALVKNQNRNLLDIRITAGIFYKSILSKENIEKDLKEHAEKLIYANLLYKLKMAFYRTEYAHFINMKSIKKIKPEQKCFNILAHLTYIINVCSVKALPKNLNLVLSREAGFPDEMLGDRDKFEQILLTLLDHFMEHAKKSDIVIHAGVQNPITNGLLLGFSIKTNKSEHLNSNILSKTLLETPNYLKEYVKEKGPSEKYELGVFQCREIAELLGGGIRVAEPSPEKIMVTVEIPFETRLGSEDVLMSPRISIYRTEKISEYTIRWLPTLSTPVPDRAARLPEVKTPLSTGEQLSVRFTESPSKDDPMKRIASEKSLRDVKTELLAKIKQEAERAKVEVQELKKQAENRGYKTPQQKSASKDTSSTHSVGNTAMPEGVRFGENEEETIDNEKNEDESLYVLLKYKGK